VYHVTSEQVALTPLFLVIDLLELGCKATGERFATHSFIRRSSSHPSTG
jgi:hypothetical protein